MALVDTNILLRSHPGDPRYSLITSALAKLKKGRETICIAPQNLVEYWVVATRSRENNGLGMRPAAAIVEIERLRRAFYLLEGLQGVSEAWQNLVSKHLVSGKQAHDANLVATMLVHGVKRLLTFNVLDFRRFSAIDVVDPADV